MRATRRASSSGLVMTSAFPARRSRRSRQGRLDSAHLHPRLALPRAEAQSRLGQGRTRVDRRRSAVARAVGLLGDQFAAPSRDAGPGRPRGRGGKDFQTALELDLSNDEAKGETSSRRSRPPQGTLALCELRPTNRRPAARARAAQARRNGSGDRASASSRRKGLSRARGRRAARGAGARRSAEHPYARCARPHAAAEAAPDHPGDRDGAPLPALLGRRGLAVLARETRLHVPADSPVETSATLAVSASSSGTTP